MADGLAVILPLVLPLSCHQLSPFSHWPPHPGGAVAKSWKRRYFVLRDDLTMSYYKDASPQGKPKGCIRLVGSKTDFNGPTEVSRDIKWPSTSLVVRSTPCQRLRAETSRRLSCRALTTAIGDTQLSSLSHPTFSHPFSLPPLPPPSTSPIPSLTGWLFICASCICPRPPPCPASSHRTHVWKCTPRTGHSTCSARRPRQPTNGSAN